MSFRNIRWENLGSFRIWLLAFFVAAIPAYLATQLSETFGTIVLLGIMGIVVAAAMAPEGPVLYCPWCSKRVKMGSTVCHHCGRDVEVD